jgi:hypothetical protein
MSENDPGGSNSGANDDALIDRLAPKIHNLINSAIASQKKLTEKQRSEDRDAFAKLLDEKLGALKPPTDDPPGDGGKGAKGGKREDIEMASLRKQSEELKARLDTAEQVAKAERQKNRDAAMRSLAYDEFGKYGIDGERANGLYARFKFDNRMAYEDDEADPSLNNLLFHGDDGAQVRFSDGMKAYIKTDQAKLYLPPSGARGAGSRPGPNGQNTVPQMSKDELWTSLGQELRRNMSSG